MVGQELSLQNGIKAPVKYEAPAGGFQNVPSGDVAKDAVYMYGMHNASSTAFDLAGDLEKQLPLFISRAQGRVMALINVISSLRRELYDAKNDVIRANQRLHAVLLHTGFNENPDNWCKDDELKVMEADYALTSEDTNTIPVRIEGDPASEGTSGDSESDGTD